MNDFLQAIGQEEGCLRLSAAFYARVAGDPELRPLFPGKSFRCATEEFAAFLIQFLDGDEDKTQYRWWLSLRESHARFQISESQRLAWLKHMEATLRSSELEKETQDTLVQFFGAASTHLIGGESGAVSDPELADRWCQAQALDELVVNLQAGNDQEVLSTFRRFAPRPSLFVGVLARMMHHSTLVGAVAEAIERNPILATKRYNGRTLLHHAAGLGRQEIVALLLRFGVDPDVLDTGHHTPLYRLANGCAHSTGPEIARMLVRAGANVNHQAGATRSTPLHMAARQGHAEIAEALIDLGASLDARDTKGYTPLDRAIRCRKPEVEKLLRRHLP